MLMHDYLESLVRGLNYLTHTKPDISDLVSVAYRFMHCPSMQQCGAAKRILCYVSSTSDFGIWFTHVPNFSLYGVTDSDFAGCDLRVLQAMYFSLGLQLLHGAPRSKKQ